MSKIIISKEHGNDVADMRTAYCETLMAMAKANDNIFFILKKLLSYSILQQ